MLKPAQLYSDKLRKAEVENWYKRKISIGMEDLETATYSSQTATMIVTALYQ